MAKRTFRLTPAERKRLSDLRLRRNLTYETLATEIGAGVSRGTLLRVLTKPGASVHETTIYQIREYLQQVAS